MKVLLVVPNDYKNVGGIYLPVNNYIRQMENNGIEVRVFLMPYRYFAALTLKKDYLSEVKTYNPDTIMVYGLNQAYIVKTWTHNKANRVMVGLLIDSLLLEVTSILRDLSFGRRKIVLMLKKYLYKFKELQCLNFYKECVFVSKVDVDFVKENYKKIRSSISYVPNGTVASLESRSKEYDGVLSIGCLTGFSDETINNNLLPLLNDIFPAIRKVNKNVKLVIAGRGCTEQMEKYIREIDGVEFLGFVENLNTFYDAVDIVITTVKKECGILNRVLEAWAYSKPVIGFRKNFATFDYAVAGIHYLAADTNEEFVNEIQELISNPVRINEYGYNGFALVSKYYTWEACGEKLLSILDVRKSI